MPETYFEKQVLSSAKKHSLGYDVVVDISRVLEFTHCKRCGGPLDTEKRVFDIFDVTECALCQYCGNTPIKGATFFFVAVTDNECCVGVADTLEHLLDHEAER